MQREMKAKLYEAAEAGDVKALNHLLTWNREVVMQVSPMGNTALHIAAYHGHLQFVQRLLQFIYPWKEASVQFVRAQNKHKNSALHEAARGGDHVQIVQALLEADPYVLEMVNNKGESPLFVAMECGRLNIVKKLMPISTASYERSDGQNPLHIVMYNEHFDVVEVLLRVEHELARRRDNSSGRTALHIAASDCRCPLKILKTLLEIDKSMCLISDDIHQQTPLHLAAIHGNMYAVRCILKTGRQSVEIADKDAKNALHLAVENGHLSVVQELFPAMNRFINVTDGSGHTPLDIALLKHHQEDPPRMMIIEHLQSLNARESVKAKAERLVEKSKKIPKSKMESEMAMANAICVSDMLIASGTFQAVFSIPDLVQSIEKNRSTQQNGTLELKLFIIFETIAFCASILSSILIVYANANPARRGPLILVSTRLFLIALSMVLIIFPLAVIMVIPSGWALLVVRTLGCFTFGCAAILMWKSKETVRSLILNTLTQKYKICMNKQ